MKKIEVTGKTVEDAVTEACIQLGISSDRLAYEVLEQGSAGILGLFAKPAKISAWEKSDEELADDKRHQEASKKAEEIAARTKSETAGTPEKKTEEKKAETAAPAPEKKNNPKKTIPEKTSAPQNTKAKTAVKTDTEEKQTQKTSAAESAPASARTEKRQLSHEEIEKRVTDFLGAIFQSIGLKETITFSYESDNTVVVDIEGDDTGIMIGKRGQTLDSLQYLTSLVVNKGREKYIRIKLDTENYRHRREETLKNLAHNMASKAKRTGHAVELEPMNPYERRIIHAALQNDRYVSTKSEGEEPYRHVVIFIDKTKAANRGSKSRAGFANHYAIYVLVEDYLNGGFDKKGGYSDYDGAKFSDLFRRQRELPFGSKLQNHALNHRLNEEFKKYFPACEHLPIIRDVESNRYWINEKLIVTGGINLAKSIKEIIEAYVKARQSAFSEFMAYCQEIIDIQEESPEKAIGFIKGLFRPNVDARVFEIASFAVLKQHYADQRIYWGWSPEELIEESLVLYKTGRTNANDGGIDFVMKPLGKEMVKPEYLKEIYNYLAESP